MHRIKRTELERFFELSLAIGTSLHAQENARAFLSKLVELTGLSFAGLWLRASNGAYRLAFSYPAQALPAPYEVAEQHPVPKKLEEQAFFTEVLSDGANTSGFVFNQELGAGAYGYFQLPVFSFVQIFEGQRSAPFDENSMRELAKLIIKFGISMDACMVHARLREQQQLVNQVQGQLEKSVARYSDLFENMSDALFILNDSHQIVQTNRAAQALLDIKAASKGAGALKQQLELTEFIHPEDRDKFEYFLQKLLNFESDRNFRCRILTDEQVERFVAFNSSLIRNLNGHQAGSRHIVRDITSQLVYENRLNQLNVHLKALVSNLQAAILFEDTDRKTLLANEGFCEQFDIPYHPDDLIGVEADVLLQEVKQKNVRPEAFQEWAEQVLSTQELSTGQKFALPNGQVLCFDAIPVYAGEERLGLLWQCHDITARETASAQLKESEERYRGILENMELGLLELDEHGLITRAFDRFCEMVGYEEAALIGQKPTDIFDASPKVYHDQQYQDVHAHSEAVIYERQFTRKDGTKIWMIISSTPILNRKGELEGYIGIHYDITDRKELEQRLQAAKNRAEKAIQAERQFLANMSHEIRTPMNAVIGMTHLLLNTQPTPEQQDFLESLKFSADSLLSLIDNILDLSKIEASQLSLESAPFSLRHILSNLRQSFQFKVKDRPVSVDLDLDPSIDRQLIGDSTRLNQIFTNLLGNAMKFTNRGTIGINAHVKQRDETHMHLQFTVFDTGIGIAHDKLDMVFRNFKQADADITRKYGGTGLGLSIVKQLVEIMGGSIWVESEEGKGTAFHFDLSLPMSEQPDTASQDARLSSESQRGLLKSLWVLLVEDNPMNQKLVSHILKAWGCHFEVAKDGVEAIEKSQSRAFDVILMDIHMPKLDGCEATARIRADQKNPNQKSLIIGLTAAAMLDEKKRAIEVGMNEFITKPFSPEALSEFMLKSLKPNNNTRQENNPAMDAEQEKKRPPVVIDLAYLHEFGGGDKGFIAEIVQTFLKEAPGNIDRLAEGLSTEDWDTVHRIAHQLKPNYMMLGMPLQQKTALSIEQMAKTGPERAEIEKDITRLVEDTQRAFPLLEDKLSELKA